MKRELREIPLTKIKVQFSKLTGIAPSEVMEIQEAFPFDRHISILTNCRTFHAKVTWSGRMIEKGSLKEEL